MQSPEHWPSETAEILQHAVALAAVVQPSGILPLQTALGE